VDSIATEEVVVSAAVKFCLRMLALIDRYPFSFFQIAVMLLCGEQLATRSTFFLATDNKQAKELASSHKSDQFTICQTRGTSLGIPENRWGTRRMGATLYYVS
jgi:hypothetical protein